MNLLPEKLRNKTAYKPNEGQYAIRLDANEAPEDLPRIFEKGYTGENGRLDKRASGIGLYLCSRICENLGHRIRAESAVGQGTRVYLELKPSGSADVWNLSKM